MNGSRFTYGTAKPAAFTLCGCNSNAVRDTFNDSLMNCRRRWSTSNTNARNDAATHRPTRYGNTMMNKHTK